MGSCGHQSLSDDSLGWPPGGQLGSQPGLEGTVLPAKLDGTSEVLLFSRRPPGRTVMARPAQGGQGSGKLGLTMGEGGARVPEAPAGSPRSPSTCSATQGHPGSSLWPQRVTQCPHCDPGGHPGSHCGPRGSPRVSLWPQGSPRALTLTLGLPPWMASPSGAHSPCSSLGSRLPTPQLPTVPHRSHPTSRHPASTQPTRLCRPRLK